MTCQRRYIPYIVCLTLLVVGLFGQSCSAFSPLPLPYLRSHVVGSRRATAFQPLASSFYGKFDAQDDDDDDDDDEEDEDDDDDDDDYDLDELDVDKFRSKMSSLFGDDPDSSVSENMPASSTASSVDELISFARSTAGEAKPETNTDWATPTDELEPGTVLLANPAKFCADFGTKRTTPSPSLLAKFGLTLPPPADLGADRRADLLPVLMIVSKTPNGGYQAVLLNRRTGYLLGDLESPGDNTGAAGGPPAPMLEKFCIQPLWFGGVDNVSAGLDMLHQCPTVEGAASLTEDGLYWGGDPNQAQDAMSDSRLERVYTGFDFKFFVQATVWSKGELEQHRDADNWFCAKVSKEVLFKSRYVDKHGDDTLRGSCTRYLFCLLTLFLCRDRLGSKRGRPLWTEIMELMGDEYKKIRDELYKNEV